MVGFFFFQFSVTEHFRGADIGRHQSLPGVFFFYDLSPIKVCFLYPCYARSRGNASTMASHCGILSTSEIFLFIQPLHLICILQVTFTEEHVSFLHFLTNVCAIVGGNIPSWMVLTPASFPVSRLFIKIPIPKVLDESLVFVRQVSCSALLQLSSYYSPPFSQVLNNARTGYWPWTRL